MDDLISGLNTRTRDVAVIGGALSGAATALLLKREDPTLSVLLVEKNEGFKRRVGEATVEVSGYFLTRVLGLTGFLTQTQLCKNGLRFWFDNEQTGDLGDCSEIGGKYLSTVPSFLVDRAVLDEEVLRRAIEEGVEVIRPATVTSVDLCAGGIQTLHMNSTEGRCLIKARWVVDASGIRCLLARGNNWWRPLDEHATLSVWSRWSGVGDWDDERLMRRHPQMAASYVGIRGTATNHMTGYGWWSWWINLKGGETSIGVVIDTRRCEWPDDDSPVGEKLRRFLSRHVAAKEMLERAEFTGGDVHFRRNLPYFSEVQSGDGFTLAGDSWAFLDPFYSPGMDWVAFSSMASVRLIMAWRRGEETAPIIEAQNKDFSVAYRRMFEALYKDKYDYIERLQKNQRFIWAIGDGVNDAPLLARANISVAVGTGAPLATAGADAILTANSLQPLAKAVLLADKTQLVIKENLIWALIYNLVAIPVAMMGWVNPWIAGIGMSISSLAVTLNAWRLRNA